MENLKYKVRFNLITNKETKKALLSAAEDYIYLTFTFESKRLYYYTGYRILKNKWDTKKMEVKSNTYNEDGVSSALINQHLTKIKSNIVDVYTDVKYNKKEATVDDLKEALKLKMQGNDGLENNSINADSQETPEATFWDRYDQYIEANKSEWVNGFQRQMKSTRNHLKEFVHGNIKIIDGKDVFEPGKSETISREKIYIPEKDLSFDEIDFPFLEQFRRYYLNILVNSKNSFAGAIKRLKFFLNYAYKMKWHTDLEYKEYKAQETYGDPIFMEWGEVNKLYLFQPEPEDKHLEIIRDTFVFQSNVGCRIEDLMDFKKSNITNNVLKYIAKKTIKDNRVVIEVPLTKLAKEIIAKYKNDPGDKLLPVKLKNFNKNLKDLAEKAKLNRIIEFVDNKTGQLKAEPIHQLISSQMARRNLAGNIINLGINDQVVKSMTGHAKNSRAFDRYYKINLVAKSTALKLLNKNN